jgi:hypothetical protein
MQPITSLVWHLEGHFDGDLFEEYTAGTGPLFEDEEDPQPDAN